MSNFVIVSESVTEGHPDKLCDQISDAIVDRYLSEDPAARVEVECAMATGIIFIACHATTKAKIDLPAVARTVVRRVGYVPPVFDADACTVLTTVSAVPELHEVNGTAEPLSSEAMERLVAEQAVTAFGFACRQSDALMPLPVVVAHRLARALDEARRSGALGWLGADCKVQVGIEYEARQPRRLHELAFTLTGDPDTAPPRRELVDAMREYVIPSAFDATVLGPDRHTQISVNADRHLVAGGPRIHSGLTGRKMQVDNYGDYARHSSSALSGKDPFRIDRLGSYAARYAAKNIVAAGLADEAEVQISYGIGRSEPISLRVQTFGTGKEPDEALTERLAAWMDLTPRGILTVFGMRDVLLEKPGRHFEPLAVYGQMGRVDLDTPWERIHRAGELTG